MLGDKWNSTAAGGTRCSCYAPFDLIVITKGGKKKQLTHRNENSRERKGIVVGGEGYLFCE